MVGLAWPHQGLRGRVGAPTTFVFGARGAARPRRAWARGGAWPLLEPGALGQSVRVVIRVHGVLLGLLVAERRGKEPLYARTALQGVALDERLHLAFTLVPVGRLARKRLRAAGEDRLQYMGPRV